MSEETQTQEVVGASFLTKGSIATTLISQLTTEEPSIEASSLKQLLTIRQICDFPKQVREEANSIEDGTLGKAIYDLARDKTNDITRLPAAHKLLLAKEEVLVQAPVTGVITEGIDIQEAIDSVPYRHTKNPSFEVSLGNIKFKKQTPFYFTLKLDVKSQLGGDEQSTITWRSNDSVSGRTVVVPVYFRLINNRVSPASVKLISLGELVFFKHDIENNAEMQYHHSGFMRAMDAVFQYGYFDELEVFVTRSAWVAVRDSVQDKITLPASTTDNYLEIVEL